MKEHPARGIVDAAIGLAFSAADTVRNLVREFFQLAVLKNASLKLEQVERGREDVAERLVILQLAGIHQAAGINLAAIGGQLLDALRFQVLELGNADAVFAGNHAAQRNHLGHDLVDAAVGAVQHGPVVGEHGHIDVHVAIAGVHVGSQHDAAIANFMVGAVQRLQHRGITAHQPFQAVAEFLEHGQRAQGLRIQAFHLLAEFHAEFDPGGNPGGGLLLVLAGHRSRQDFFRAPGEAELRVTLFFNVDAIDKMRKLGQGLQGKDNVLVHLEGVSAAGNRAHLLAVGPEELGLGGIAGGEQQGVGMLRQQRANPFHAAAGLLRAVAGDVNEKYGAGSLRAGRLDLVADGADVFVIEMLKGQQRLLIVGREGEGA